MIKKSHCARQLPNHCTNSLTLRKMTEVTYQDKYCEIKNAIFKAKTKKRKAKFDKQVRINHSNIFSSKDVLHSLFDFFLLMHSSCSDGMLQ